MASRPPLGLSLADVLGAPEPSKMSRGQIIAGIIGDALAGAAGRGPAFGQYVAQQRQQADEEAQWGRRLMKQKQIEQQFPDVSPMERDAEAWVHMSELQKQAYMESQKAREGDPVVTITLPNGQMYSGPRSGLAQAMMGGGQAPQQPVGKLTPINGGPQGSPLSGPFPDIGPYHRY